VLGIDADIDDKALKVKLIGFFRLGFGIRSNIQFN